MAEVIQVCNNSDVNNDPMLSPTHAIYRERSSRLTVRITEKSSKQHSATAEVGVTESTPEA